jgi:TRAP-type C4-dicarboxylate transport system substrate-binding protein
VTPQDGRDKRQVNNKVHADRSAVERERKESMNVIDRRIGVSLGNVGALVLSLGFMLGAAQAQDKTFTMKITLPTLNETQHQLAKNFAAAVEKDSGGRIKGEVYPNSQLGSISRQIEGLQFGAIQAGVIPPEFFVGVDERFEVMCAPGLADDLEHAQRIAADPAVAKLILGLGTGKGLHGVGLTVLTPSSIISRTPIRHLSDFQGKKLRIFASDFQSVALKRLGATPVAMTLGDVLPAIQQGTIDGAIAALNVYVPMHYVDAAKYVTQTNQPMIFSVIEISQKWYDSLPPDLQQIVDKDGNAESLGINQRAIDFRSKMGKGWTDQGGELISLPRDEQAEMMHTLASVGEDVSKSKPAVREAYEIVADAAKRTRQAPSQ